VALYDFAAGIAPGATVMDTLLQVVASGSYTPVLTATTTNPTLGTGSSVTGWYVHFGSISSADEYVVVGFQVVFGTSGAAAGSGTYRISLPVTASTTSPSASGTALVFDDSTGERRVAMVDLVTTTTLGLNPDGASSVDNDFPWVWANNDSIRGICFYRA
jgi:hypothetical protein